MPKPKRELDVIAIDHRSLAERLAVLDQRFGEHEGRLASEHVRELIPEVDSIEKASIAERLSELDKRFGEHKGMLMSQHVRALIPEIDIMAEEKKSWKERVREAHKPPPKPTQAPVLWKDRNKDESPFAFVERVYQPWLGKGLTRADTHHLDRPLYQILQYHERRHGLPEGFELPTVTEYLDQWAKNVKSGEVAIDNPLDQYRYYNIRQRQKRQGTERS